MKTLIFAIPIVAFVNVASAETLREAVDVTLKTNPDVLSAVHERNAVSKEVDQARAGYFPTLDLGLGTGYERTSNPSVRNNPANGDSVGYNRNEASLNARQMLFDGMQTKNEVGRQKARTNSRAHTVYSASENTALEAVNAYLNVLRRQKIVEMAQNNLESHQRTHDQIMLRSERGVGRRADVDQSLGRLSLAETNLMAEQSNLRDAETNYMRVVGIMPTSLTDPESPAGLIPASVEEAINTAINNHPTLKSANADVESAHFQHDTALAPFFPRLDFEVGARQDNNIDAVRGSDRDFQAMLRLRYNLYNGGRDQARREETAALINQAAEIRNNTHRQVEESTRLSWNALQTVRNQMVYFETYADAAEKTRDAYQQQFSLGQRTLLDLLDSENEMFRSRISLIEAQYDERYAMYRILNSMGLLLESLEVQAPDASTTVATN
ncbi:TolC family outer membrane protein [Methylophaga sp. OBS3]|uniref:TolC family outer membrane protein n=1 Tax=Methylophaga sp. OBS3 TaxID=2991934 RepID=UPI00224F4664|nr:TolC family outer membrane protein [Methylophaga sp. OBS3]MCX4190214.1 TolC family outer membrane protein [Methylophaga sp. OBS3]